MNKEDRIILLRYSDNHGIDTIKEHINTENQNGYTWWIKLGKQPQKKYLMSYMAQDNKTVFLYSLGHLYICECIEITTQRPQMGYPAYYDDFIFKNSKEEFTFFKLKGITQTDVSILSDFIVSSSGKPVLYDLKKTISSYFVIQNKDIPVVVKKARPKRINKPAVRDNMSCKYKKDGKCNNRSCVNYMYECERPNVCAKQKI